MGSVSEEAKVRMHNTFERTIRSYQDAKLVSQKDHTYKIKVASNKELNNALQEILDSFNPQLYNKREYKLRATTTEQVSPRELYFETVIILA